MAITIQQEPTTPNQANADLVYLLSSTNTNEPQFQLVMEVGDGTDTYTFKQQPNTNNRMVFDMGQVASDFLDNYLPAKSEYIGKSTNPATTLSTVFYEEYGTSLSSSVASKPPPATLVPPLLPLPPSPPPRPLQTIATTD